MKNESSERLGEKLYRHSNLPEHIRKAIHSEKASDDSIKVKHFLERLKEEIKDLINSGKKPKIDIGRINGFKSPFYLPSNDINNDINKFSDAISGKKHGHLVDEFKKWMDEEGITWKCRHDHDGVGTDSWTTLIFEPSPELIKEINNNENKFSYRKVR